MTCMEELKYMLYDELEKFVGEGEITTGALDAIDKLTHSIKSIDTILAMGRYSDEEHDSVGRFSREHQASEGEDKNVISQLEKIMDDARDERTKEAIRSALHHIGE